MAGLENSSIPNLNLNVTSNDSFQVNIFKTFVLCFSVLFGPPMHAYILWLIVTGRGIASEFLYFQVSVSEIIICVNSLLTLLALRFTEISASLSFAMGLTITGRPLFQCLICVERYLAVVHPVTFLKFKPLRYKLFCSAALWFTALGSCLFSMFTVTYSRVYRCGILLQFLLFLSVNLFCCVAVLRALKQSGPGERGREREEENHMKRRAFHLILIITVTMVIMYGPVILLALFYLLLSQDVSIYMAFSILCFIVAGFVQPVLYLHRAGKLPFFVRAEAS